MTIRTPTYLKGVFEQGDRPQGADYEDLIDSSLNLTTDAVQIVSGAVRFHKGIIFNTTVSAATVSANNIRATIVSATTLNASNVSASNCYADTLYPTKTIESYTSIAATGSTQGSAASTNYSITFVSTNEDERSIKLANCQNGRVQRIIRNSSGTVANIYPADGCNFIGTAANARILLSANETLQVIHVNSSAYSYTRW